MARLATVLLGMSIAFAAPREAVALTVDLTSTFRVIYSSNPIDPRDWYEADFGYDTDTNVLSYQVTQRLGAGSVGFSGFFADGTGTDLEFADASSTVDTDFGSYVTRTGTVTLADEEDEARLLGGTWYYLATSSYTTQQADLVPVPEPGAAVLVAFAALLLIAARRVAAWGPEP